jgi:NAD(P)-dependent dehydrogenase (short-subunit alcohol dehydrogenase family)
MDLGLAGRVGVVTGADGGVGLETARLLRAEGAKVLLVARDAGRLAAAAEGLDGGEEEVATLPLDLGEPDSGEQMLGAALEEFGGVDVLVNGAAEAPTDDLRVDYERSVMAPMRAMKAIAPVLAERGWGRIVNVCPTVESVAGAAELALSRLFADRYAKDGVLVNSVCPNLEAGAEATAREIVFLCSERASQVAGATWSVDRGAAR